MHDIFAKIARLLNQLLSLSRVPANLADCDRLEFCAGSDEKASRPTEYAYPLPAPTSVAAGLFRFLKPMI